MVKTLRGGGFHASEVSTEYVPMNYTPVFSDTISKKVWSFCILAEQVWNYYLMGCSGTRWTWTC